MKQIKNLQKAPTTPQQLREELCNLLEHSFIYAVDPQNVDMDTREYEVVIRAKLSSEIR